MSCILNESFSWALSLGIKNWLSISIRTSSIRRPLSLIVQPKYKNINYFRIIDNLGPVSSLASWINITLLSVVSKKTNMITLGGKE